jgi:KAP family P-loop domain
MFSFRNLNSRQENVLNSWHRVLQQFVKREWFSLFLSTGLGILVGECIDLLLWDHSFQRYFFANYIPSAHLDDPKRDFPYVVLLLGAMFLAVVPVISTYIRRGIRSWWAGVTSGLVFLPFAAAVLFSLLRISQLQLRLVYGCSVIGICFLVSFALHLMQQVRAERDIREDEFAVPARIKSLAGTQLEWSDDPIQTWERDALGRAALVDSLSVKIMVAKTPVVALLGPLGAGKTSILNLLRENLGDKTITVSFSTWLPGSQETLTSYLLSDIANECNKQYVVPGLRQSTRRLATALGQKVPLLGEYLKLIPATTQKEQINNLKSALLRLPKRVVVLLDEIDRMEKEEIMTLLKVIRGIATLPNLSFVCGVDLESMIKTTAKDNEYFEKFFPVFISVPLPDPAALSRTGIDRMVAMFLSRDWFENATEVEQFKERIESVWDARIAPFCKTLRAVGLLTNDVSVAAAPLRREVDPLDLTLIEMLHRFRPQVYSLIARNSFALTGGETLLRGGGFRDDKAQEQARDKLLDEIRKISHDEDFVQVQGVINELFPLHQLRRASRSDQSPTEETDKRIREPGIFPTYFRYELPDEIFSSVELDALLKQLEGASSDETREDIFFSALQSMKKGSLKRDDFLRKLEELPKSIPLSTEKSLALAAVKAADKYTYDSAFPTFAEAGHVLRFIHAIAHRISKKERIGFLRQCILDASDDTMAFRIVTFLPKQEGESNLDVSIADLYRSFTTRMRKRYGREADVSKIDLTTSDPWAFNLWGSQNVAGLPFDPEDRKIQCDFWRRYIGNSRSRLAQAFRGFFLPFAIYQDNPELVVENKIPVADLKKMYEQLPEDQNLTDEDRKALATLRRFLDGEFKNGISPTSDLY